MNATPQSYTPQVVNYFLNPPNVGRLSAGAQVIVAEAGQVAQGVRFVLTASFADERIRTMRFEAYGCPHCIAAGAWLTERLVGATHAELERWRWWEAAQALDVPAEKHGRLLILEDAVRQLAARWRQGA